ncbi:mercuric reductase [Salpingoeca rosetta]|uniref:Mercuric reductase n=1 Tax=Salpingoeca rosetta (strain ATCC 50818 / BSB-021) TaxID=946362 RepID=F2U0W6_SALR5|nr:mercuric reductase [Salpingoeca rosetta]EGD80540.1 mercuric reductase [Salpingoeca rosetta]|eukprot:XP_004997101.1 mercuric reductase [Salpingoeca rosetta]
MADDDELDSIVMRLEQGLEVKDRRYRLKSYKNCFVGSDAVALMMSSGITNTEEDAVLLGNVLLDAGYIAHVLREHRFENKRLFYRFTKHEDHGAPASDASSWAAFLGSMNETDTDSDYARADQRRRSSVQASLDLETASQLSPMDTHNLALLSKVHPADWKNPEPKKAYDLVVIGAGAGGLVSAAGAAGTGAKVALIEARLMGGDCLNVGCVPSKALLHAAAVVAQMRNTKELADLGISVSGTVDVDFGKVMERMRRLRAEIADNDSAQRFTQKLGVNVYLGRAKFTGKREVVVNDDVHLKFQKCVIATGGSPRLPAIDGLSDAYQAQNPEHPLILTNESIFNLTELPARLGVIGAGPIGCELAQAFARFGSEVQLFARSGHVLAKEDQDAAQLVEDALERDGVELILDVTAYTRVHCDDKSVHVTVTRKDEPDHPVTYSFSQLLVAAGRRPNVGALDLDKAGVAFDDSRGVHVNDRLQTSNDRVYAVGDVCSPVQFTHASDFMARMVVRNCLFFGKAKFSQLIIPWCTYTSPEVAHVGLSRRVLDEEGKEYDVYEKPLAENDRAIVEGQTRGFVRILCKKHTDKIIGATIVAAHAGDLISEVTQAMQTNTGLGKLAAVIHPYPTQADAIRACGDLYNKTRLTTSVRKVLRNVIKVQRSGTRR